MQRAGLVGIFCLTLASLAAAGVPAPKPQVVKAFDATKGQLPESLALDAEGNFFLSLGNSIYKLTDKLELSIYGTLKIPADYLALGVKIGPDGCVYTVSGAFAVSPPGAFLWRICKPGAVEQLAALDASGFPNDLAFDDQGRIYITDPFLGRIWRFDKGKLETWIQDVRLQGQPKSPALPAHFFGVDGITFNQDKSVLYVGNLDAGSIYRIPLKPEGSDRRLELVITSPLLRGADGLAFDADGTLYVAVNGQDSVVAVNKGRAKVIGKGAPYDAPSGLVFGTRPADKDTLFITSFAINRALGAVPGPPQPALLSLKLKAHPSVGNKEASVGGKKASVGGEKASASGKELSVSGKEPSVSGKEPSADGKK
jgi:sugar lactone lactonase YvrE